MLLLLARLCASVFEFDCAAPLKHADPVPGATLQVFSLLTRHGLRAPNEPWVPDSDVGYWVCDSDSSIAPKTIVSNLSGQVRRYATANDHRMFEFPPNCNPGDLLLEGMLQHRELGEFYRRWLIEDLHFLPNLLHPELLHLRATYVGRTFKSAESFMTGLYPPATPGEILTIETGSEVAEPLLPLPDLCGDVKSEYKKWVASEEFKARAENRRELYKPIYALRNMTWDGENWMFIGDYVMMSHCSGQELPDAFTDEIKDASQKDIAYYTYGLFNRTRGLGASAVMRELLRVIQRAINGETQERFILFSSHDMTVAAVLHMLTGEYKEVLPRFRSHLATEIWKTSSGELQIRFVHDGEPVPVELLGGATLNSFDAFVKAFEPYKNFCLEYE